MSGPSGQSLLACLSLKDISAVDLSAKLSLREGQLSVVDLSPWAVPLSRTAKCGRPLSVADAELPLTGQRIDLPSQLVPLSRTAERGGHS